MFSHVTVGVADLDRAARFYDAVLGPLGLVQRVPPTGAAPDWRCWVGRSATLPRFYAHLPFDGALATSGNGTMVAFLAPTPASVSLAHSAGLAAGGSDEGAPGPRPHYGDGSFGAYLRDPDGNKVHVVHRGDLPA